MCVTVCALSLAEAKTPTLYPQAFFTRSTTNVSTPAAAAPNQRPQSRSCDVLDAPAHTDGVNDDMTSSDSAQTVIPIPNALTSVPSDPNDRRMMHCICPNGDVTAHHSDAMAEQQLQTNDVRAAAPGIQTATDYIFNTTTSNGMPCMNSYSTSRCTSFKGGSVAS